jgi:hypothetical protein
MNIGYFLSILQRQGEVTPMSAPCAQEGPLPPGDSKIWIADYDKWNASATPRAEFVNSRRHLRCRGLA